MVLDTSKSNLDKIKSLIEKQHGSGSIMRGKGSIVHVDIIPTGIISIDIAMGVMGLPQGRIIEIYGAESSGKTTTCLQFIASAQKHYFDKKKKRFGNAALIDAEHSFDPAWAEKCGVNMDDLLISQPDSGEQALQICETLIDSKEIDLIVIDSVAALVPKKVLEGEIGDTVIAAQAQLMSTALNKLKGKCNKSLTTVIFINQIREKAGIVFGNPEVTPGGRALKFYASMRMEVKKGSAVKIGDKVVGFKPTIKVVKNKVAPPFMIAEYDICTGTPELPIYGIDATGSMVDFAVQANIVNKKGNFYQFEKTVLGNGRSNAIIFLNANKELYDIIKGKVYEYYAVPVSNIKEEDEEDDDDSVEEISSARDGNLAE
jgi:recombination protein RecA